MIPERMPDRCDPMLIAADEFLTGMVGAALKSTNPAVRKDLLYTILEHAGELLAYGEENEGLFLATIPLAQSMIVGTALETRKKRLRQPEYCDPSMLPVFNPQENLVPEEETSALLRRLARPQTS